MKKRIDLVFEIMIIFLFFLSIGIYTYKIITSNVSYDISQSYGPFLLIPVYTILLVVILIGLIILLKLLVRYQSNHDLVGVTIKIRNFYANKKGLKIGTIIGVIILIFIGIIATFQDTFLYYPTHISSGERTLMESPEFTKINIPDGNKNYSGWAKISEENLFTIIYFGGNAEASAVTFFYRFQEEVDDFEYANFIMVDYPGFGLSDGKPSEKSLKHMSLLTYDYIVSLDKINNTKIIVMGFSLGTGLATYVAANRDVDQLILIAPYSSMIDVVNSKIPIFYGPIKYLWRSEFNTMKLLPDIKCNTLIIYSNDDMMIRPKFSKKVLENIDHAESIIADGLGHNELLNNEEILKQIKTFIFQ
ncbi:MAG: alpha/beta hydrolase [Acholeplasmataceae bacterium]|jgi:pimeloyl-ACP methyl ester carboxylesterase